MLGIGQATGGDARPSSTSRSASRARKLAIWARLTGLFGENAPGPVPVAIPASAAALMLGWWFDPLSSPKASAPVGRARPSTNWAARMRNVAIWARETWPWGEY